MLLISRFPPGIRMAACLGQLLRVERVATSAEQNALGTDLDQSDRPLPSLSRPGQPFQSTRPTPRPPPASPGAPRRIPALCSCGFSYLPCCSPRLPPERRAVQNGTCPFVSQRSTSQEATTERARPPLFNCHKEQRSGNQLFWTARQVSSIPLRRNRRVDPARISHAAYAESFPPP